MDDEREWVSRKNRKGRERTDRDRQHYPPLLLARSCIRIARGVHIPRCVVVQALSPGEVKAAGV